MDKATHTPSPATDDTRDIVLRLRDTPNWLYESYASWKDSVCKYSRAPFEAADEIDRLRAEVERLAAQAAPSEAQADLVIAVHTLASHFENTLYALRDDAEAVTKAKGDIAHALQISAKYNRNGAAAQPSQAPVVQAGEYPPLPEPTGQVVTLDMVDGRKARVIRAIDPHWMVGADGKTLFTEEQMRAYVDADRASSGATTAQAVYVPRLLTALEICRQYPDFDADTAIGTMLDAAIKGEPNEMLDLVSPHTGAAQAVRMLITEFNVGRFCLSEDDCIAQGIDFSAYERGVADAAEAFSRNA